MPAETHMNIEQARFNMIEQQIRPGRFWISNVFLTCSFVVKREDFAPAAYRNLAFADMEIPIGSGQIMLAPKIEAKMMQELGIKKPTRFSKSARVRGYMAALLAARPNVISVEIRPEIAAFARKTWSAMPAFSNVTVEVGNGVDGWSARGPLMPSSFPAPCQRFPLAAQATARRRSSG